jgi:siroheme decarboxylase
MGLTERDRRLVAAIEDGLPLVPAPYAAIAAELGIGEDEVRRRIEGLIADGTVRRFGIVVRHRRLGYRANAMVVWDVPDAAVGEAGRRLACLPYVTLCYRRPRRLPEWPYNLFAMIHGRDRAEVEAQAAAAASAAGIGNADRDILFSRRCFKQRGARYGAVA